MVMKVLVHLSQKSILVRQKNKEKAEQAEDDPNAEGANAIIEEDEEIDIALISDDEDDEDDEDYDCNEDLECNLYDSKLDDLDEVLFLRDLLASMQQQYPEAYGYYFG